jgi:hypothetical protein
MKVYKKNKLTNEIISEREAIEYSDNYIVWDNHGHTTKEYCDDTEYFSDKEV